MEVIDSGPDPLVPAEEPRLARARLARDLRPADEARPQRLNLAIRYVEFELPDVFVIGYGLDRAERFRHLPFIAVLED